MASSGLRKMLTKLFSNTKWCMSVGMPCNLIGHIINSINLMADVKPFFVIYYIALADIIAKLTVAVLLAKPYGRCYCHIGG